MYKLFLCLKYLRRRYLAIVAMLAVALCVAMVLIVVSVMDGFLRKVETSAKGLFGEIVVDATSLSGIGRYDQFIATLTGEYYLSARFELAELTRAEQGRWRMTFRAQGSYAQAEALVGTPQPQREAEFPARAVLYAGRRRLATLRGELTIRPDRQLLFVCQAKLAPAEMPERTAGLYLRELYVRVGEGMPEIQAATPVIYSYGLLRIGDTYTTTVQVCGIRLPERLAVTNMENGLFVQAGRADASFDPPLELIRRRMVEHLQTIRDVLRRELALPSARRDEDLIERLQRARLQLARAASKLDDCIQLRDLLMRLEAELSAERAKPPRERDKQRIEELTKNCTAIRDRLAGILRSPDSRVILGLGIPGLSFRTPSAQTIRSVVPPQDVVLSLLPVARGRLPTTITPNTATFAIVDDASTGVYTFDSKTVYVPFDRLQILCNMDEWRDIKEPSKVDPARCSQIQIKVKEPFASGEALRKVRAKVQRAWSEFERVHGAQAASAEVIVHTWREKLSKFIGPIQKQRTLVTIMFGVISLVSVLLIFAIFYMIVMQKVRDIGVIRAVGGSAAGVAQIFLGFGAATAAVGCALGLVAGCFFVRYINPIEDAIAGLTGTRIWDREVFLFEEIPNQVEPSVMVVIAAWAIVSGLVGALIPAVRAATMEPAEAVRYE